MSTINDGGPAFPAQPIMKIPGGVETIAAQGGMTLRAYFAAHAPEPPANWRGGDRKMSDLIAWRWYYADAMLEEMEAA